MKNVFDTYEEALDDSDDGVVYTTGKTWRGGRSVKGKYCNEKYCPVTDENENGWVKVELESDYDRGMREAMKDIAKSCGKTFSVDIGYLELPKLVYELVNKGKPKPRTKVVYEKVEGSADFWEVAKVFHEEEVNTLVARTNPHEALSMSWMNIKDNDELLRQYKKGMIYRKVEKEIDWRDELVDLVGCGLMQRMGEGFQIGGVYFPEIVIRDIAHFVQPITDKP